MSTLKIIEQSETDFLEIIESLLAARAEKVDLQNKIDVLGQSQEVVAPLHATIEQWNEYAKKTNAIQEQKHELFDKMDVEINTIDRLEKHISKTIECNQWIKVDKYYVAHFYTGGNGTTITITTEPPKTLPTDVIYSFD